MAIKSRRVLEYIPGGEKILARHTMERYGNHEKAEIRDRGEVVGTRVLNWCSCDGECFARINNQLVRVQPCDASDYPEYWYVEYAAKVERHTITRRALSQLYDNGFFALGITTPFDKYVVVLASWSGCSCVSYTLDAEQAWKFANEFPGYAEVWEIVESDVFLERCDWLREHDSLTEYCVQAELENESAYMIWPRWREDAIMVIYKDADKGLYMPMDAQGESPYPNADVSEWKWVCVGWCEGEFPKDAHWLPEYEPWLPLDMLPAQIATQECHSPYDVRKEMEVCHA